MFLQNFVADVVNCHTRRVGVQSYLYTYNQGWDYVESYAPRLLDSVVLQRGEKEQLIDDVQAFRKSKQRYVRLGIPYHRGYLLYGPPGTGKTSLVSALAAHFGLSIYVVHLTDFTDRGLMNAVNQVPGNSVLLFEDIDCAKGGKARDDASNAMPTQAGKENAASNGVTLSGLLNVLDGFYAPANVLFVMTTNHIEVLDEAVLWPGRIDYRLFLGKATIQQKVDLYCRFFPKASELEAQAFAEFFYGAETMAEFQGLLLGLEQEQKICSDSLVPALQGTAE